MNSVVTCNDADPPVNKPYFSRLCLSDPRFWAGLTIGIGCIGLLGWLLNTPVLASFIPSGYQASPNTLFLFIIVGLSFFLPERNKSENWIDLSLFFLMGIIYAITLWTVVDILTNYSMQIDHLIRSTEEMAGIIPHGRMSPITAVLFLIIASGILGADRYPKHSAYTGLAVFSSGFIIIIGYLYGAPLLYAGSLAPVSLVTAVAFITSAIALILKTGSFHSYLGLIPDTPAYHQIIRVFIPFIVIILIVEGWIISVLLNKTESDLVLIVASITLLCIFVTIVISRSFSRKITTRLDDADRIRKQAEDALSESLTRMNVAADNADVGFWTWDFKTDELHWDKKTYEMHQVEPGTPLKFNTWLSTIHPDSKISSEMIQAMKEQDEVHTEFKILLPDSSVRYFEGHGKVMHSQDGVPERMVGITWDITSRIASMQALNTKNEELGALNEELAAQDEELRIQYRDLEKANDDILNIQKFAEEVIFQAGEGIIVTDKNGTITIWNHFMDDFTGIRSDQMTGNNIFYSFPEMVNSQFAETIQSALSGEQETTPDMFFSLTEPGKQGWFTATCAPLHDNAGVVIGSIITIKDITNRKESEQRIIQSESLLRSAENLGKIGGFEWDVKRKRMFWTEQTYAIHEIEPDSIPDGSDEHISASILGYDENDRQMLLDAFYTCSSKGEPYLFDLPFTTKQGNKRWVRTKAEAVIENGEIVKVIGTLMDITHEKTLEKEKSVAIKQIQRNFADLAILNDGIRNPLAVISMLSELKCPGLYKGIEEQVKMIDSMVNQLDTRWIESESVLKYLQRHYNIYVNDDQDTKCKN